ncbi:MAG: hypothetical protein KDL87_14265, partial [Verrucomicrobiae bacterium]|nr:hypothetical protein [Verrucomicrobiae bacterium]
MKKKMTKTPRNKFTGILGGWDEIIRCGECGFSLHVPIDSKSAERVAYRAIPDLGSLFAKLLNQIEKNFSVGNPSENLAVSNWRLRLAPDLDEDKSPLEKRLEKRFVELSKPTGPLAGWFNQIPAASGYFDPRKNRKNSIDLVYETRTGKEYEFIELKLDPTSGWPFYATFEILSYGFLFLFTRIDPELQKRFEDATEEQRVLKAEKIRLIVLAPESYFSESEQGVRGLEEFQGS